MSEFVLPPSHVVAAFGADGVAANYLNRNSGAGYRYGDLVLLRAGDPVLAAWTAGVFESLRVSGIRIPRPVRSLDGRWVVGGWCAQRFLSGRPAARHAEAVAASLALDAALAQISVPRVLADRGDLTGWADRVSWDSEADTAGRLGDGQAAELWFQIAARRMPVGARQQVVHADVFGHVLFAGSAPPAVVGFCPLARPAGYSAAILVVDAMAWGGASIDLVHTGSVIGDWAELLRRACLFRLAYAFAHPRGHAALPELMAAIRSLAAMFD